MKSQTVYVSTRASMLTTSSPLQVQEISIDYTNCNTTAPRQDSTNFDPTAENQLESIPSGRVSSTFKSNADPAAMWGWGRENYTFESGVSLETNVCILSFTIPEAIKPPILFYYRLTNFYQNHRRYVKSVDIDQLKGDVRSASDLSSGDCSPLDNDPETGLPYYPCGLIANSMFNDTFSNLTLANPAGGSDASGQNYTMTVEGTSWSHEGDLYGKTKYKPEDVVPPPNWQQQYPNGRYNGSLPDLHTWEQFQVWMRTAGLPTFSKLYQRNDHDELSAGTYRLKIYDRKFFGSYLVPFFEDKLLMFMCVYRLPRRQVQRYQIYPHLYAHRHGRQEPVPRYRIPCCGRYLHLVGRGVPGYASH